MKRLRLLMVGWEAAEGNEPRLCDLDGARKSDVSARDRFATDGGNSLAKGGIKRFLPAEELAALQHSQLGDGENQSAGIELTNTQASHKQDRKEAPKGIFSGETALPIARLRPIIDSARLLAFLLFTISYVF